MLSRIIVTIIVLSAGMAHADQTLSREEAQKIISETPEFRELSTRVYLNSNGFAEGVEGGLWTGGSYERFVLTEKGKRLIHEETDRVGYSYIRLKTPQDIPSVQVTGITSGIGGTRVAEFSWEYNSKNLPTEVKSVACPGGTGVAAFQLYDDGWRLVKHGIQINPNGSLSMKLSEEEEHTIQVEKQRIEAKKQRIEESKTPTRRLGSFTAIFTYDYWGERLQLYDRRTVEVTDTNLQGRWGTGEEWLGVIINTHSEDLPDPRGDVYMAGYSREPTTVSKFFFATKAERDAFLHALTSALNSWRSKYPDVYEDYKQIGEAPEVAQEPISTESSPSSAESTGTQPPGKLSQDLSVREAEALSGPHDSRTTGTVVDDEAIELKAGHAIRRDEELWRRTHINFTSYNNIVLVSGEAPTEELKKRVIERIRGIPKVRRVYDEITIAAPSSLTSRSSDTLLTASVKGKLITIRNGFGYTARGWDSSRSIEAGERCAKSG